MAAPSAIVIACPHRAPSLRLHTARLEAHSPPPTSALATARRWPARSGREGQGTANARQPTSSPRNLSPVAYQHRSQRRRNSKAPNEFGLLSPKTSFATPCHGDTVREDRTGSQDVNKKDQTKLPTSNRLTISVTKMRRATQCNVSPAASLPTAATETTSAFCRQKRDWRHNAPRDNNPPAVQRRSQRRDNDATTTSPRAADACRGTPRSSPGSGD